MGMPRKTAEQTTSTTYRGADGNWHARVTMGRRPDGTTERKHVQRRTKTELREAVRELERSRDAGTYVWTQDDLTLDDWLSHWLDNVLPMTARWKTLSTYRSQMSRHVLPSLGNWGMSEIQPEHLESHYRRLQSDGHSVHTIRAVHRVLRSALNEAVRRRRLASNPALIARPPRAEDVEVEPLSIEESRRILTAAQTSTSPARWSIALSLGLRQGEALGSCGMTSISTTACCGCAGRCNDGPGSTAVPSSTERPRVVANEARSATIAPMAGCSSSSRRRRHPSGPSCCPSPWWRSCAPTAPE